VNRFGRKLGLCVPITGAVLGTLCFLYIHTAQPPSFALVAVLGSLLMGLSGGYSTFNVSVFSYTSDATLQSPLERKQSFPM
jgi:MFS family permease